MKLILVSNLPEIVIYDEEFEGLVEEILSMRTEVFKNAIEQDLQCRWVSGELIKNNKKAIGRYSDIAKRLGISKETVEDWVWFYKEFPEDNWDKAFMKLPDCNGKLNFSNIRKALKHRLPENCDHEWEEITKWKCKKCGLIKTKNPNNEE